MFYEAGSREKFNAATERDEQEEHRLRELQQEATMNADRQGMEPSSSCPLGTEAPPYNPEMSAEEMKLQPLPIVKRHIVSLLVRGENRLLNAPDYGSYLMMGHMHVGYAMIDDAEALLRHFGLMTEAMEESIEDLRHKAREIQQDLDLTD
jgi:hypothetical protein